MTSPSVSAQSTVSSVVYSTHSGDTHVQVSTSSARDVTAGAPTTVNVAGGPYLPPVISSVATSSHSTGQLNVQSLASGTSTSTVSSTVLTKDVSTTTDEENKPLDLTIAKSTAVTTVTSEGNALVSTTTSAATQIVSASQATTGVVPSTSISTAPVTSGPTVSTTMTMTPQVSASTALIPKPPSPMDTSSVELSTKHSLSLPTPTWQSTNTLSQQNPAQVVTSNPQQTPSTTAGGSASASVDFQAGGAAATPITNPPHSTAPPVTQPSTIQLDPESAARLLFDQPKRYKPYSSWPECFTKVAKSFGIRNTT